jgi:eukaryotic-like serine/threonine-protein kinase
MAAPLGSTDDKGAAPLPGDVIGERYRIESLIDEGAMGRVFLGEHIHMRKRVAIKLLKPELTRVPEVLERFEREARAAGHIEHPHVAGATDFGKLKDGSVYLILEYIEGHTLRRELKRSRFDVPRALRIARQIASALSAAHSLQIVHRDLKPENVMLVERGSDQDYVKVLDFGVAKVPIDMAQAGQAPSNTADEVSITKAGMVFGTPDYMAPEQALGQSVDGRADLYSLGVILYELLAGVRPFRADHELGILGQQLSGGPPPFKTRAPGVSVPSGVEAVVFKLLGREASQRPSKALEVVALLDAQLLALGESTLMVSASGERTPSSSDLQTLLQPAPQWQSASQLQPTSQLQKGGLPQRLSERVRSVFPEPLQGLPAWLVVLMPITALTVFAFLLIQLASPETPTEKLASPTSTAAASALGPQPSGVQSAAPDPKVEPPKAVTDAQLDAAVEAGELAVLALLERYPDDGRAHVAKARLAKKNKDTDGAVKAVQRALELDPDLATDAHVGSALWWSVQKPETQAATLALLKGPMKARGADILYDLANTEGVRPAVAQAARAWLKTRAFERVSTPAAAIAGALLVAEKCEVRKGLLKRAENVGDQRAAKLLKTFAARKGCVAEEATPCNACLDPKVLAHSIETIARRETPSVKVAPAASSAPRAPVAPPR